MEAMADRADVALRVWLHLPLPVPGSFGKDWTRVQAYGIWVPDCTTAFTYPGHEGPLPLGTWPPAWEGITWRAVPGAGWRGRIPL